MSQDLEDNCKSNNHRVGPANDVEVESIKKENICIDCRSLADGLTVAAGAVVDACIVVEGTIQRHRNTTAVSLAAQHNLRVGREVKRDDGERLVHAVDSEEVHKGEGACHT